MKTNLLFGILVCLCLMSTAQNSDVILTVNWPQWSTENKVELYSPNNVLLQTIDNGYDGSGTAGNPYNETTTAVNYPNNPNTGGNTGYYVIVYDTYGDGWNGNGSLTITSDGVTALTFDGNFDTSATNSEITQTIYFAVENAPVPGPGVPVFYEQFAGDTRGYIEYIPGNLPIIISAPHGGVKQSGSTIGGTNYPDNDSTLPDRSCGTVERDDNTDILVREIQEEIFNLTGCYAHVIINNLHRSKLDPNREINEATCGDSDAIDHWNAWHNFIDQASTSVTNNWGKGLYIDLHGQSHTIPRIEIGYNITSGELNGSTINTTTIINKSTIKNLVNNNINNLNIEDLVRGNNSLGELFQEAPGTFYNNNVNPGCGVTSGYRAVPSNSDYGNSSCDDTQPHGNAYFNGNFYNNRRHGSGNGSGTNAGSNDGGGTIDGIMTEVNRRVRDLGTYNGNVYDTRPQTLVPFAKDYAAVVLEYIDIHYNDFTEFNYASISYDTTDSDPTPTISGVSGGVFSSTTGLTIDSATGSIDVSSSTVGNYVVTYEAGTCGYYSSTTNIEITDNTLGLDNFENVTFKVFPNPTKNTIKYQANRKISTIKIFNLLGQEMNAVKTNAKNATIDLSNLASGSYLMSFFIEEKLISSKLIIKN
ncbi:T9SS type A sorting domain-containing protein [Lacinutrix salivirga]